MKGQDCIICGNLIGKESEEHVLPEAVGGKKTVFSVCESCNNLLGAKVDWLFTDDPAIQMLRERFKIPNRDHNTIDLISFMKKGQYTDKEGKRVAIKDGDGIHLPQYYTGNPDPEVHIVRNSENGYSVKYSGMDYESVFTKAQRVFKKEGINVTDEQIRSMILSSGHLEMSPAILSKDIIAHYDNYVPCAVKIAYEAMCDYYPFYLEVDPLATCYREYLLSAIKGVPIDELILPEPVAQNVSFANVQKDSILVFRKEGIDLLADVCFFSTIQYTVCVSHASEKYDLLGNDTRAYFLT